MTKMILQRRRWKRKRKVQDLQAMEKMEGKIRRQKLPRVECFVMSSPSPSFFSLFCPSRLLPFVWYRQLLPFFFASSSIAAAASANETSLILNENENANENLNEKEKGINSSYPPPPLPTIPSTVYTNNTSFPTQNKNVEE